MSCRGRSSWPWGLAFLTSLGSPDQVRGQVFSSPAALNSNAAIDNGIDVTPQIVTDRASNWLVAWNGPGNDVLVSRSTDNGATWTPVAAINPTPATRDGAVQRAALSHGVGPRRRPGHDRPQDEIGVAGEELGDAVDDDVGAEVERALEQRRRKGVVDDDGETAIVGARHEGVEVGDVEHGVAGRLDRLRA